jgi:hypothetical protein
MAYDSFLYSIRDSTYAKILEGLQLMYFVPHHRSRGTRTHSTTTVAGRRLPNNVAVGFQYPNFKAMYDMEDRLLFKRS